MQLSTTTHRKNIHETQRQHRYRDYISWCTTHTKLSGFYTRGAQSVALLPVRPQSSSNSEVWLRCRSYIRRVNTHTHARTVHTLLFGVRILSIYTFEPCSRDNDLSSAGLATVKHSLHIWRTARNCAARGRGHAAVQYSTHDDPSW